MEYSGPIRRDPLSRPPCRWSPIILTLLCAGGMAIIYWLGASKIVSDHALTLAIVVAVPVASFILAGEGARVLFRRSSDRSGPPHLQPTDLPPIDQKIGPVHLMRGSDYIVIPGERRQARGAIDPGSVSLGFTTIRLP